MTNQCDPPYWKGRGIDDGQKGRSIMNFNKERSWGFEENRLAYVEGHKEGQLLRLIKPK